ncbi:hypothetical protein [Dongia sp.]|uniref:hypothetical protein n=1 Tax=Dongia sp. TaxID=1977262 RepID=UPI0035B2F060
MTDETGKQAGGGEAGTGAGAPELEELARRLLDLWQDQLTAVAANPDLAAQAARLMAAMPLPGMWLSQLGQMGGQGGTSGEDLTRAWARMTQSWMAQDWWKGETRANGEPAPERQKATPPGSAAAAAAPEPRGGDLDELSRRLAGIERRLEQLAEQPGPKSRRKPPAKPKAAAAKPRRTRAPDRPGGSGGADDGAAS